MTLGDNDDKELWTPLEFKTFSDPVATHNSPWAACARVLPSGGNWSPKGIYLKIHTLGVATVAALMISQLSSPLPDNNTATSSYKLDQATFSLTQLNSMLVFKIEDKDTLAIDRILINGEELHPSSNGQFKYDMGQTEQAEVALSSDSAHSISDADPLRHIASKTFPIRNIGLQGAAIAQSTSATRTRIRYQTFIESQQEGAPLLVCTWPLAAFNSYFYGNNRSWDPDAPSFKTRFDTIITWGSNPSVVKETTVGVSIRHSSQPLDPKEFNDYMWASDESMVLGQATFYPDYVSYRIRQNVPNPFCSVAEGIQFDFMFYVKRNGSYTFFGDYLPVPNHEVYARDNLNTSWRTLSLTRGDNFFCFIPWRTAGCMYTDKTRQGVF